jgi:hypothetical protein
VSLSGHEPHLIAKVPFQQGMKVAQSAVLKTELPGRPELNSVSGQTPMALFVIPRFSEYCIECTASKCAAGGDHLSIRTRGNHLCRLFFTLRGETSIRHSDRNWIARRVQIERYAVRPTRSSWPGVTVIAGAGEPVRSW